MASDRVGVLAQWLVAKGIDEERARRAGERHLRHISDQGGYLYPTVLALTHLSPEDAITLYETEDLLLLGQREETNKASPPQAAGYLPVFTFGRSTPQASGNPPGRD